MIPETVTWQVQELSRRIRSGGLDGLDPVDLGDGAAMDALIAARLILVEVHHLAERDEQGQPVSPWRWRLISEQLGRLRLVIP